MIILAHYSTCEGGIWKELYTDIEHQNRIRKFLAGLSVPLRNDVTVITGSMAGISDHIVVHAFKFSEGSIWDARNGFRPQSSSLDASYDAVYNDYSHEEKL